MFPLMSKSRVQSGFDSRRYHMFCLAVGLERGPLSLMRINEEIFERKIVALVSKTEINDIGDPPH
jgi:hypothetical protein